MRSWVRGWTVHLSHLSPPLLSLHLLFSHHVTAPFQIPPTPTTHRQGTRRAHALEPPRMPPPPSPPFLHLPAVAVVPIPSPSPCLLPPTRSTSDTSWGARRCSSRTPVVLFPFLCGFFFWGGGEALGLAVPPSSSSTGAAAAWTSASQEPLRSCIYPFRSDASDCGRLPSWSPGSWYWIARAFRLRREEPPLAFLLTSLSHIWTPVVWNAWVSLFCFFLKKNLSSPPPIPWVRYD